jgi:hypothetical protein
VRPEELAAGLGVLLGACNGFYAFESALHVFPSTATPSETSVAEWNEPELWRETFDAIGPGWCCFAEDVFGAQFAIGPTGVVGLLDPELGVIEHVADDVEAWAQRLLDDYEVLTGWPLAHEWQVANGPLRAGRRLIPKVPFVLGGAFSIDNLYAADAVSAMRYRGELAAQMRHLPHGSSVTLRIIE